LRADSDLSEARRREQSRRFTTVRARTSRRRSHGDLLANPILLDVGVVPAIYGSRRSAAGEGPHMEHREAEMTRHVEALAVLLVDVLGGSTAVDLTRAQSALALAARLP
jgi:hypothetical protein